MGNGKRFGAASDFVGLRNPVDKASHAPGYVYGSPEVFQHEVDTYFMKDWLFVGREEEIEKPGDYMARRLVGEPVIISRSRDGQVNAFYNMCVHRGVEVAEGKGNTRAFKCPYHGWVYDIEGKLVGAAHMQKSEGFDISNCRLRPIRVGIWRKNIFITFNIDAPPLEEFIEEFEKDFGFLHTEKCRLGNRLTLNLKCNWKFVHENLMDFYHVNVLHVNTFGATFSWDNDDIVLKRKGGISLFYKDGPLTPNAQPLLGKMPWMEDREYNFACTGFMQPNLTLFGRIDAVRMASVWPVSESECELVYYHLFPEEVYAKPDIADILKVYREYSMKVLGEDQWMVESMQKAMSSRAYVPGRMSVFEKALHHYLNGHVDRVFGTLGRERSK